MAWYDPIAGLVGPAGRKGWEWGQQRQSGPQIGENPYQGRWDNLIGQLEQQSAGQGPSLAGNAYKAAHAQGLSDQMSMASGGSAGRARQAGMNMTRMNQGLAHGYGNARLQEQLAARQQLSGALGGAGMAWFGPQEANLKAQLSQPTNMQMLMQFLQQFGSGLGSTGMFSKAATGGAV
jgi:hypothetical protein